MPEKLLIGITGGIGSGKTTVCREIASMGYPVFYSDQQAKDLVESEPSVKKAITALLGEKAYGPNGYDKVYVASKVFNDRTLLLKLESIIHPAVRKAFETFAQEADSPYIFNEAAILFEKGGYRGMDFNVLITATPEERIRRVMARDGVSEDQVRDRMKNQWSDEQKEDLADFVIRNENREDVKPQLEELFKRLDETLQGK